MKAPSEKSFGVTFACVFCLLSALQFYRHGITVWPVVTSVAVLGFLATAFAAPAVLRPLNLVWLKFGMLLHRIVNPVITDTQSLCFPDPCCAKGRATFWDPALSLDHQRLARRQRDDLLRLVRKELVDRLLGARTVG